MGVSFSRGKVTTNAAGLSTFQEYTGSGATMLTPLMGISRIINEGRANKQCVPYTSTVSVGAETIVEYRSSWTPLGQEGWIVKIQCTLKTTTSNDEIYSWQGVDTGQILLVRSNHCDNNGAEDDTRPSYDALPEQSLWYVDKITINTRKGTSQLADMELTLVRCWLA